MLRVVPILRRLMIAWVFCVPKRWQRFATQKNPKPRSCQAAIYSPRRHSGILSRSNSQLAVSRNLGHHKTHGEPFHPFTSIETPWLLGVSISFRKIPNGTTFGSPGSIWDDPSTKNEIILVAVAQRCFIISTKLRIMKFPYVLFQGIMFSFQVH